MAPYRRFLTLAVLVLSMLFPGTGWGLDPAKDISQYNHRAWLKIHGLPQNSVYALAQTPDGYLWIGTQEGLARFDGLTFRTFSRATTLAFKGKIVQSLSTAPDSSLWIGTTDGAGLYRYSHGEFRSIPLRNDGRWSAITALYAASKEVVWVGTTDGLYEVRMDSVVGRYTLEDGPPRTHIEAIIPGPQGEIITISGGVMGEVRGGHIERCASYPGIPQRVSAAHFARDGSLWIGTADSGIVRHDGAGWHRITPANGPFPLRITSLEEDSDGTMWAGTANAGLMRIHRGAVSVYSAASGLSSDDVNRLLIDREGCLWVGTISGGLNRFKEVAFTTYSAPGRGASNFVFSLYQDVDGKILAGSASGDIFVLRGGKFVATDEFRHRFPGTVLAMCRDRDGSFWVGTAQGAFHVKKGKVISYPLGFVTSIVYDRDGRMWIGSVKGLFGRTARGMWKPYLLADSGKSVGVRFITYDRSGAMWLGSSSSGLLRIPYPGRAWEFMPVPEKPLAWYYAGNGLGSSSVSSLVEDSSGTIWIATYGSGLARLRDGNVVNLCGGGLPADEIHQLCLDRRGFFWMSTNNGVYRVRKDDVNAYADGKAAGYPWSQFGTNSGMLSDECNGGAQNASLVDRFGRIWFGTAEGGVVVDPDSLPVAMVPPAVNVEEITIGKRPVSIGGVPLATQDRDIEFSYSAVSLAAPENIRFRVMLKGFDPDWIDAGTRRLATYTNLTPGSYSFHVQAANADGAWTATGTSFDFTIKPHWFQTWWFALLMGVLVMTVGATLHAWYRRDRDRQLVSAQLESKLTQARLQVLEMQLQPHFLFNTLNGISVLIREDAHKAMTMINRLSDFLRSSLERSGVQEITLREEILFVDRYLQIELLRFADRLNVQREIEEELLDAMVPTMILQPIVENAIRHGVSKRRGPVTIRIAAMRENGSLKIDVADNGAGLPGHNGAGLKEGVGLSNTRARLRQLYGPSQHLELSSPPTGGVTVGVTIPYHIQPVESWNHHPL